MAAVVYPLQGYPAVQAIEGGDEVTIRPMVPEDRDRLLEFFRRIPEEERFYLKEDVTSARVIQQWAENLDYGRTLPLLAFKGERIVADATLHHRRAGARRHVGEVRIVVDPAYRNRGIGRALLHRLIEIARDKGLERLVFEVVAQKEEAARRTAQVLGFVPVAVLMHHVRDMDGTPHDLVIMELRVIDVAPTPPELF